MNLPECAKLRVCEFLDVTYPRLVLKWIGKIHPRQTFTTVDALVAAQHLESKRAEVMDVQAAVHQMMDVAVRVKLCVFGTGSAQQDITFVPCPPNFIRGARLHLGAQAMSDGSMPRAMHVIDVKDFVFVDYVLFLLREWSCENPDVIASWKPLVPFIRIVFMLPTRLRQVLLPSNT
jgi:hypothetical protein